jgi:hypothetical protein
MERDFMAPWATELDLDNVTHKISPQEFMANFLKVDEEFIEKCRLRFSLDEDSKAPPEWQEQVRRAIHRYRNCTDEPTRYYPFLKFINLVLERAEKLASEFPRFKSSLKYTIQDRESPDGGTYSGRFPDILGSATIDGKLDSVTRWGLGLFPLEFKKKEGKEANPILREIRIEHDHIEQYRSMEETMADGSEDDVAGILSVRGSHIFQGSLSNV